MCTQDEDSQRSVEFRTSSRTEARVSRTGDPKEGVKLIKAFVQIPDPSVRLAIIQMVERLSPAP
jgi:hypothetical protein